ncbi:putative DNA-directed RNA polymerases I and III subunit protein [Mycosarcoma maydis]|uniref:DNA-directed RNA polymerases I and III subunit RPAC1 n=1 Tax=Mycosarcoma maydis TaxID=5270 RepID=A0A0D1E6I1_MYCMD|nr:putative DNA-directed RNA polymerases I and III subunit protein [Ustilago maydis 521]KIS69975.1 putative DNA-directed RNA polymerases I and III subunit protein [Ustilago maydis 521]|eukprot:XP_011388847.1 putative DNA-directed RNA polymerases I and III subunit protein [Ustilago maydis 521]
MPPKGSKRSSKTAAVEQPMDVDEPSSSHPSGSIANDPIASSIIQDSKTSVAVDQRRLVEILPERVGSVANTDFPLHYPGENNAFSLAAANQNLKVIVTRLSDASCEFDLIGVDASIANAVRRVLMAEVPTVAIEHVYIWNNTSIIQDEVLSHRLGLVPLAINPDKVAMRMPGDEADDSNTVVFHLKAKCERNRSAARGETDPDKLYIGHNVYSEQLRWDAKGGQEKDFADSPPRPVQDKILIAKLRPGQELDLELHCEKGIGKDHAKFSPVATATYRLLPHIQLLQPIPDESIDKFVSCFPPGVIGVQGSGKTRSVFVQDARKDTISREVFRHHEFEDKVKLGRVRDHFLFDLESTGIIPPEKLLPEAIRTLRSKIATLRKSLDHLETRGLDTAMAA